jgi:hypothetical protein
VGVSPSRTVAVPDPRLAGGVGGGNTVDQALGRQAS